MIKTSNLTFNYNETTQFQFPDITLNAGQSLLVLGESGCGKTTLLHLLAGLLTPNSGSIEIDSTDIATLSNSKRDAFRGQHIGLVYQKAHFVESLNVLDNMMISPFSPHRENAMSLADQLGIGAQISKNPKKLSIGEQQRMSIARALMTNPKLILADEPTSALDNKHCETVIQLLKKHAENANAALIIVTHDDRLKSVISNQIELAPQNVGVQ